MRKRDVEGVPTWPFDTRILGRFLVIILPVTAALIARIIIGFLGI